MLAGPGGWSAGASSSRKSGPNCATGIECPQNSKWILTSAEWPPRLLNMEPAVDISIKNARTYAGRNDLLLVERLGFGIHGSVYVVEHKVEAAMSAFEALGIHLADVSPNNVAFLD